MVLSDNLAKGNLRATGKMFSLKKILNIPLLGFARTTVLFCLVEGNKVLKEMFPVSFSKKGLN